MKKSICLLMAVLLLAAITACHRIQPADSSPANSAQPAPAETQDAETAAEAPAKNTMTAYHADGSTVTLEDGGDGTWKDANGSAYYLGEDGVLRARGSEDLYTDIPSSTAANTPAPATPIGRQDGERFDDVIVIEGMEEAVRYEHIVNKTAGFEMDYDYESFVRQSEEDRELFISVWDDPSNPENYLEVRYDTGSAELVTDAISAILSQEYDLIRETRELGRAGDCTYIEASELKGTGRMADELQMVYIIPAADGSRIATAHCSIESAEGFGRRFSYMMNTLEIIGRNVEFADSADYGELPAEDFGA